MARLTTPSLPGLSRQSICGYKRMATLSTWITATLCLRANTKAVMTGIFCGSIIFVTACKGDVVEPRDILEVSDSAPTPEQPAPPSIEGGVPQELSDIRQPSDIDFGAYSKDLAKFVGLEIGMSMEKAEIEVLNYMAPEQGSEGKAVFEMDKFQGYVGGQAFVATIDGLADDSVKAQQLYAIGKKDTDKKEGDETYSLIDYGMRVKCWRGENTANWQAKPCP